MAHGQQPAPSSLSPGSLLASSAGSLACTRAFIPPPPFKVGPRELPPPGPGSRPPPSAYVLVSRMGTPLFWYSPARGQADGRSPTPPVPRLPTGVWVGPGKLPIRREAGLRRGWGRPCPAGSRHGWYTAGAGGVLGHSDRPGVPVRAVAQRSSGAGGGGEVRFPSMNPVQLGDTSKARSRVDRAAARTSAGRPKGQPTGVP